MTPPAEPSASALDPAAGRPVALPLPEEPPPQAVPQPGDFGDVPIRTGIRLTLGLRVPRRGDTFYFLARSGVLTRRYARRFPLTAEGWAQAWAEFAGGDPEAARAYQSRAHQRSLADAAKGPPSSPPGSGPTSASQGVQPDASPPLSRPTNAFAIAALVMGVWCFTVVGAVLALIFGAVSLQQIKETDEGGESLARAAIILGCVGIAVGAVALVVVLALTATPTYGVSPGLPTAPPG